MLQYKPDAQRVLDRYEAWWLCQNDTPLVEIRAHDPVEFPSRTYETQREAWFDFEFRIEQAEARMKATHFLADSLPCFNPNLGPDILATIFGADMEFAPDTSWITPYLQGCQDLLWLRPDFQSKLWKAVLQFTEMSLNAGRGKWLTMFHDLHPNADIPSALMSPEVLCMEFADDPDLVQRTLEHVTKPSIKAYEILQAQIASTGQPTISWLPAPHMGRMYIPQCDFSAMISTPMFVDVVLPSLMQELSVTDRAIYHLDGPSALRHLDVLLEIPQIHAIQWVFGAGNGPARKWQHVYEKIQAAGKAMQVIAEEPEDILELSKVLKPQGVYFSAAYASSLDEAHALLSTVGVPA